MFIAALFIIAKTWKHPKYIFHNLVDKQTMVHWKKVILLGDKNKWAVKPWKEMEES